MALTLAAVSSAISADLRWDFKNAVKKDNTWTIESRGSSPKGRIQADSYQQGGGVDGGGALICGPNKGHRAYVGKLADAAAAIEVVFKLNAPSSKQMTLFSYQENTWGRAYLGVYLTGDSRLGVLVNINNDKEKKKFELQTEPAALVPGQFHTLRVTLESKKMARIYLDGKLLAEENEAMAFVDFTEPPVDQYHPFCTVGYSYMNCDNEETFDGLIAGLSLTELKASGSTVATAKSSAPVSRADINALVKKTVTVPVIDGKLNDSVWRTAEWTMPFLVLGAMSQTINGQWETADPRFTGTASTAAMLYTDDTIYAAIRSPFPAGMKPRAEKKSGGEIWEDDCVEFFLYPPEGSVYYQVMVNANGAWTGLKYFAGSSEPWNPQELQVAASCSDNMFEVEIAVPFAAIDRKVPASGSLWTGNFAREGATCGGLSSWAPVGTSFTSPERFGKFVFGSRGDYFAEAVNALQAEIKSLPEQDPAVTGMLAGFQKDMVRGNAGREAWTEFHNRLGMIRNAVIQAANKGKTHLVWQHDIWSGFGPDVKVPFGTRETESIVLEVPRGARALTSFLVTNLSSRALMTNISFKAEPAAKDLNPLVRFREMAYIELNGGKIIPDPIFELPLGSMLRVAPGNTGIVWVDIDARTLQPGNYRGTVELYPSFSSFEGKKLSLELRVSPVDISTVFVRNWTYAIREPWITRALQEYEFNCIIPIPHHYYPQYDQNGKAVFPLLDEQIQAMLDNGVPLKELLILFYPEFSLWADLQLPDGRWVKFMEPDWQKEVTKRLLLLRDYLKSKYNISYDQYAFSPTDEPNGDPDNPKDKAYFAFAGGKFIKGIDPKFRLFANPYKLNDGRQQRYFELFEILEPFYPMMNRELIDAYRNSGREIWSYVIYEKSVSPKNYRHIFWNHLDAGFEGPATFYDLFAMSGDGFNSYDSAAGDASVIADYGTVYLNDRLKKLIPSRRLEAWYLGYVDFKLAKFCREHIAEQKKQELNTAAVEAELAEIIQLGYKPNGNMDEARTKLLQLGEKLIRQ